MSNNFNYFLIKEEQLIAQEIQKNFLSNADEIKPVSQIEIHSINANLLLTDNRNVAYKVHNELINSLIKKGDKYGDIIFIDFLAFCIS